MDHWHHAGWRTMSAFGQQDTVFDVDSFSSLSGAQHASSQDATAYLPHWDADGNQECAMPFDPTTVSTDWLHQMIQVSAPCSDDLRQPPTYSSLPDGEQDFQSPTMLWPQLPGPEYGNTGAETSEVGFPRPVSTSWPPTAFAAGNDGQSTTGGSSLYSESFTSYTDASSGPEPRPRASSMTPHPHGDPIRAQEFQETSAGGFDGHYMRKRGVSPHAEAVEYVAPAKRKKRRRPPSHTRNADSRIHTPSPTPRRESTSSDTTTSCGSSIAGVAPPKQTSSSRRGSASSSVNLSLNANANNPNSNPNSNRASASDRSLNRNRNRAAASRYRAKTQAAFSRLEAAARDVSDHRQSLLARAGRLRDEVFQLKNELLRHADCDCPLIRGYLSHAAVQACAGLRTRTPSVSVSESSWGAVNYY